MDEVPGENIILPEDPSYLQIDNKELDDYRKSLIKNTVKLLKEKEIGQVDLDFLCEETKLRKETVIDILKEFGINVK